MIVTTARDLETWLSSEMPDCDGKDRSILIERMQREEHPAWGSDWSDYLDEMRGRYVSILVGPARSDEAYATLDRARRMLERGEHSALEVPPACRGQIVEAAYGWLSLAGVLYLVRRLTDRSEPFAAPAYAVAEIDDDEADLYPDRFGAAAEPTPAGGWISLDVEGQS